MSQRLRYKDSRERYPGPGQYIRFSEFGILVSRNARQGKALQEEMKNGQRKNKTKTEGNEPLESNQNIETTKVETHGDTKPLTTE